MAWNDIDLGAVSAYAVAVENGYKGTPEEWARDQADAAKNAQDARKAAEGAKASEVAAKNALDALLPKQESAIGAIGAEAAAQVGNVSAAGAAQVQAVRDAGKEQADGLAAFGATERGKVAAAGDAQVARVEQAGNAAEGSVRQVGVEVLESLPQDYTETVKKVARLSEEIFTVQPVEWVQGGFSSADGTINTNANRLRTDEVALETIESVTVASTHKIGWYAYDAQYRYLAWAGSWLDGFTGDNVREAQPDAAYIKLIMGRKDDAAMSVADDVEQSEVAVCFSVTGVVKTSTKKNAQAISEMQNVVFPPVVWEMGGLTASSGNESNVDSRIRTGFFLASNLLMATVKPGYVLSGVVYSNKTTPIGSLDWASRVTADTIKSTYPNAVYVRLLLKNDNGTALVFDDAIEKSGVEVIVSAIGGNGGAYSDFGLPILRLYGDTSAMTKDFAVPLDYIYGDKSGTCTCKWQGSSSVRLGYPKRNYTIKFDTAFEAKAGWGEQDKYCMKANWVDPSALRNVVNAQLWGQVVASRNLPETDKRTQAPNHGAIDGFPVIIAINNEFIGLYTFNIPKDGWMFAMGDGAAEYVMCSEDNGKSACQFKALAVGDGTDFSVEHAPDGVEDSAVVASFNALVGAAMSAGADWETTLAQHLDIDSVIDYFIFVYCISGHDNLGKNILYGTYDGTKWFMSAYDLDTTYGSNAYGTSWFAVVNDRTQFAEGTQRHKLAALMYNHSKVRVKARYQELRQTVLSDENVWYMLTNFATLIPRGLYNMDAEKWPTMPATSTANVVGYMEYYRMHCAYLDKEVASWTV